MPPKPPRLTEYVVSLATSENRRATTLAPTMEFAPQPSSIPHCGSYTRPHRSTVPVKPNTTTPTIRPAIVRAFSFSDTCDPRTPPRCLNLWVRGSRFEVRGSIWSIRCPDTRQSTTRWTREPLIWTDPPRSAPIRPDPMPAGGTIATAAAHRNRRGITKTRPG